MTGLLLRKTDKLKWTDIVSDLKWQSFEVLENRRMCICITSPTHFHLPIMRNPKLFRMWKSKIQQQLFFNHLLVYCTEQSQGSIFWEESPAAGCFMIQSFKQMRVSQEQDERFIAFMKVQLCNITYFQWCLWIEQVQHILYAAKWWEACFKKWPFILKLILCHSLNSAKWINWVIMWILILIGQSCQLSDVA